MLLVNEASNLIITEKNRDSYLSKMISVHNNTDSFPKMRFSDCVKKNMPKKPESTESTSPRATANLYQDDCHQHSGSENEEEDPKSEMDSSSDDEEEQRIRSHPNYMSKVDYALRLGYDESHLMTVLKKLGPEAEQNDILLAELVKLFASTNKVLEEPEFVPSHPPESALQNNKVSSPTPEDDGDNLRMIVIDGSNVAMQHGNREVFSCKGIKYAVDYFKQRGHQKIVVFVPLWRKESPRKDAPITDQEILTELEKERILVFTPARTIKGRRVACYDDRYILKVANELDGIVVSNDNYRDLLNENEGFRKVIEERLLMYSFMEDKFMPPDDPLGRHGPSLDNFLRKTPTAPEPLPPNCPYGKKCTYGNKCKYHHPERGNMPHKTVTEKLAERYKPMIQELKDRAEVEKNKTDKKSKVKATLSRTKSISQKEDDTVEFPNLTRELKTSEERQRIDDYNEKLTKLAMNIKLSESSIQEKFCNTSNNNNNNNNNNNIGPDLSVLSPHCSTTNLSNRFQSPPPEPLVSGHLQVAKKLSDDANKDAEKKSMGSNTTRNCLYTNNSQYSPPKHSPQNHSQQQHSKVSRQLGIYNDEDPRLKRNHSPNAINGSHVHFWNEPPVDHRYKNIRPIMNYQDSESYHQNQSSLLYTPVMSTLTQMQNTSEKFLSFPPSSLARQSSYPSTWMHVPIMDQYSPININLPHPTYSHSMSNNHDQIYTSGLYEPVHPNSGPGTPVSFPNTGTMPRASYIDPNQYPFSPTQLSPTMMNCFQMHQTPPHHCPQQNLTHSPTRRASQPTSMMTQNQSSSMVRVQETEIYQKLCALFPEKVVLEVLKQYPNETDPIVLCRHLVSCRRTESPEQRAKSM